MKGCHLEQDAEGIVSLTFDLPGKVNVMNDDFFFAMEEIMLWLEGRRETIRGVIITSAKRTFFAGGDLKLMGRAKAGEEAFLLTHFERLKRFFRRLEKLGVPVVGAINGSALGGGFELALACNRRIALRRDDIVIGLPEVKFGILPGAGGVVRLTRLIGLEPALAYLLSGKQVDVDSALSRRIDRSDCRRRASFEIESPRLHSGDGAPNSALGHAGAAREPHAFGAATNGLGDGAVAPSARRGGRAACSQDNCAGGR